MRVVIDTNVLISAVLSPNGVPSRILGHFRLHAFEWIVSEEIFREYVVALQYDRVRKRHKFTDEQLLILFQELYNTTVHVIPTVVLQNIVQTPMIISSLSVH